MDRLTAALAMFPGMEAELFDEDAWASLARVADLVAPGAVDLATAPDHDLDRVEVLIGGWGCTPLDGPVLDRLPRLRLLAYGAGSVRSTITDEVWARGIQVSSAAAANAVPVAEFTFAAIVMIAKDVFRVRDRQRAKRGRSFYVARGPAGPVGTRGMRVGVVGASKIGRLVIERLQSLDVDIAVADPFLDAVDARTWGVELMELDDLCAWSDILTIHAPELPATHHLLDARRMALLRDGAWLVNTARGSLVDTAALETECVSGRLCAFIDTPDPEPLPTSSPLWDCEQVVLTPHIAGSLGREVARMGALVMDEVARFAAGTALVHPVVMADMDHIA